ncbi:RHG24 protein, partial [Polyodon spathula]|nr:RHG24 protein [Polyodon spathula]
MRHTFQGGDRERMTANHETYLLMASTQNDMEDWVKTIRRVIWAPFGGDLVSFCFNWQCTSQLHIQYVCQNKSELAVEIKITALNYVGRSNENDCNILNMSLESEAASSFKSSLGIFGQKLEETVRYERRFGNKMAPMLVEQCVDFIRLRGLKEEGLFRLPGQANLVKELQDAFDCGEKPSFDSSTDVHTVASLLKLYLRELPEPVIPFAKYEEFLTCTKLLTKDEETGMKDLIKQVKSLPPVNYNLLQYTCRFLDEVQSYSGVNKMSVQNLATVFGPNILRPKMEDPMTIMEGTVLVQQLMSVLIGKHDQVFPKEEENQTAVEVCNNNNATQTKLSTGQLQNKENNNTKENSAGQCSWEKPESPQRNSADNSSPTSLGGNRLGSPRSSLTGKFDITRSPPLMVKKNPAFNKGSGTKMGTSSVPNGGVRMGLSSTDVMSSTLNGRNGIWMPNGCVTMRDNKQKDSVNEPSTQQNRLSTYDNVQQQSSVVNCEDKQSVDSATWSTSSCEISLPDNSNSCRSSTTTCPEQDFFGRNYEDPMLDGPSQDDLSQRVEFDAKFDRQSGGGRSSRATSSSDNSETFVVNTTSNHSALHSLVASLKQEMAKQKTEFESRIKSLEQRNFELETEMVSLHDELDQERKKYTMVEIKMRNAERAKEDAEKRNEMLQKEMEQFFSTFGELTVEPRRPERGNTIWIQ